MKLIRTLSFLSVAAVACSGSTGAVPSDGGTTQTADAATVVPTPAATPLVSTELDVRTSMRQLWEDHVFWTRIYIIDAVSKLPADETTATAQRLLQNQVDLGNAVRRFYGNDAGDKLTALLKEHILGAVAVLDAAIAGDAAAFKTANDAWYANGYAIAQLLSSANPHWPLQIMVNHMNRHLDLTLAEAKARLSGDYAGEVKAYDDVVNHILTLSDVLTGGLAAQFPSLIGPSAITPKNEQLHVAMRKLWEDHVQWTRIYIVDQTANLPDTSFAAQRLLQNQVDIGNAIVPFYGQAAGTQLTMLLQTHITGAVAVLQAVESGNQADIDAANAAWYANADDIAHFLAAANPHWRLADLQNEMKMHLDKTLAEAAAHLGGNWGADVLAYDIVVADIRGMADILSDGIAAQFPAQL